MERSISIEYPGSLASSLNMGSKEFQNEMKVLSLVKLYELGRISSGLAAKLLGRDRLDFLELLKEYKVSYFHKGLEDQLASDLGNA